MHVNNQLKNATDPHLFFTFNGLYSRNYNLFIENTNKGGGTKIVASPDKTVSFATPDYQNNTYYLGTTKKQKTFKHTLAADGLTPDELREILQILKVGEVGLLSYDTNKFYGWQVVITDVGEVSQWEASYGLIVEFSIEFKTINDWHAISLYTAQKMLSKAGWQDVNETGKQTKHTIANEFGIPEIVWDGVGTVYLPQVSDEHSFVNLAWEMPKDETLFKLIANNSDVLDYVVKGSSSQNKPMIKYYGQYGFTLVNNQIIEDTSYLDAISGGTSDLLILDNTLPQDVTKLGADDQTIENPGEYKCEVQKIEEGSVWADGTLTNDHTFPGDNYAARITIVKERGTQISYQSDDYDETQPAQKIYLGICNVLSCANFGGENNYLEVIKHSSI